MSGYMDGREIRSKKKMTNYEKVQAFHMKYDLLWNEYPRYLHPEDALFRVRLMMEELAELTEAIVMKPSKDVAKELADLLYVVYGTAVAAGIDIDKVFDKVHKSNMTKSTKKDPGGKIIKGDDYVPVDMATILED
jgi:predicted HAD superfamily Cof-like phosphohydrolase